MASRRDWLLQQLGITQWTLRRPTVLQGEVAVTLPAQTRLIIVASPLPAPHDPLIGDVLHSLSLRPEQAYPLTPEQIVMLPASTRCPIWCLGLTVSPSWASVQFNSPALNELYTSASAKRALWQQISEHLPLLASSEAD